MDDVHRDIDKVGRYILVRTVAGNLARDLFPPELFVKSCHSLQGEAFPGKGAYLARIRDLHDPKHVAHATTSKPYLSMMMLIRPLCRYNWNLIGVELPAEHLQTRFLRV